MVENLQVYWLTKTDRPVNKWGDGRILFNMRNNEVVYKTSWGATLDKYTLKCYKWPRYCGIKLEDSGVHHL